MASVPGAAPGNDRDCGSLLSTAAVHNARVFHTARYAVNGRGRGGERETMPVAAHTRRGPGVVMALCCIGFLALIASQWQGKQRFSGVTVRGATGLSERAIRAAVDSFATKHYRDVVFADVRSVVERLPYVRRASVYVSGEHSLTVDIEERKPIGHVVGADGALRYVDAEGNVLPPPSQRVGFNVPLIRTVGDRSCTSDQVRTIAALVVQAERMLDASLFQSISEIVVDPATSRTEFRAGDITWKLPSSSVNLNGDHSIAGTLADMNVFWRQAALRLPSEGAVVDMRWRRQVIVRKQGTSSIARS